MGTKISDTLWKDGLESIYRYSNNMRHSSILFKILHPLLLEGEITLNIP